MKFFFFLIFSFIMGIVLNACNTKNLNYISYHNRKFEIDSSYNSNHDEKLALKNYKQLFRKFTPIHSKEFETYIKLADKNNSNFGKQKALFHLIKLYAPDWKRNKMDKDLIKIYTKYGIDSSAIEEKLSEWKSGLNKQLIDSFSIAFQRQQEAFKIENLEIRGKNLAFVDKLNENLLNWTFKNFGYPSLQKIGLFGHNEIMMPVGLLMYQSSTMPENIDYYTKILLDYVKSGDLTPENYAAFIDNYRYDRKLGTKYGQISHSSERYYKAKNIDKINQLRKSIGAFPLIKNMDE